MLSKIGDYFVITNSKKMADVISDEEKKDDAPSNADTFAGWLAREFRALLPYVKRAEPAKGVLPTAENADLASPD